MRHLLVWPILAFIAQSPLLGCSLSEGKGGRHGRGGGDGLSGIVTYMQGLAIYQLDLATGERERVASGYDPYVNSQGQMVWRDSDVIMGDLGDGPEELVSCWLCYYPTLSPDGEWVTWHDDLSGIKGYGTAVARVSSGATVYEIEDFGSSRPAWSEDGYLVLTGTAAGRGELVAVLDLDSGDMAVVTEAIEEPWAPAVSPDGQWIAAKSADDDQIYLAAVGGDSATRLTRSTIGATLPFFSPDGSHMILAYGTQEAPELRIISLDEEAPFDLDAGDGMVIEVDGSPLWADGPFTWR